MVLNNPENMILLQAALDQMAIIERPSLELTCWQIPVVRYYRT